RFFSCDRTAIAAEVADVVGPGSELVELTWVTFPQAKQLDLPIITLSILEELEDRLTRGFGPELPVPFYYERRGKFVRELL
ncbi:MAG: NUDIX hydrolase, partial [Microvirga sp.]